MGPVPVIFGKWDEAANKRSYQLYLGGPALDSGKLTFRISTDGAAGTVNNIFQYPWQPLVGGWYNLTVTRTSGVLRVFVNGIQIGTNLADTNTYYVGTELSVLGAQMTGTSTVVTDTSMSGWLENFRLTVGVSRYSANFTPPATSFTIGGGDPSWASVAWLSTFDTVSVIDESSYARTLTKWNSAAAYAPLDGSGAYQTVGKYTPNDDTFISADLVAATGIMTMTALPAVSTSVTVATKNGTLAAVYVWKAALVSAFDVLIGASIAISLANLKAAINRETGEGTLYGTGTTANNDVIADLPFAGQLRATALVPGTAGNALASTTTATGSSWTAATLAGGANIPAFSQFYFSRMPSNVTTVDSITLIQRGWKIDAGTATTQLSFVGPSSGVLNGVARPNSTAPTLTFDTFDVDPDVPANPLTPTAILTGRVRINRTV